MHALLTHRSSFLARARWCFATHSRCVDPVAPSESSMQQNRRVAHGARSRRSGFETSRRRFTSSKIVRPSTTRLRSLVFHSSKVRSRSGSASDSVSYHWVGRDYSRSQASERKRSYDATRGEHRPHSLGFGAHCVIAGHRFSTQLAAQAQSPISSCERFMILEWNLNLASRRTTRSSARALRTDSQLRLEPCHFRHSRFLRAHIAPLFATESWSNFQRPEPVCSVSRCSSKGLLHDLSMWSSSSITHCVAQEISRAWSSRRHRPAFTYCQSNSFDRYRAHRKRCSARPKWLSQDFATRA